MEEITDSESQVVGGMKGKRGDVVWRSRSASNVNHEARETKKRVENAKTFIGHGCYQHTTSIAEYFRENVD